MHFTFESASAFVQKLRRFATTVPTSVARYDQRMYYSMLLANPEVIASTALESEYEACYHQLDDQQLGHERSPPHGGRASDLPASTACLGGVPGASTLCHRTVTAALGRTGVSATRSGRGAGGLATSPAQARAMRITSWLAVALIGVTTWTTVAALRAPAMEA